ncbi:MAG: imidazole glycerol phosphate synthase subunit HisH [Patescibacteria group bacterium]
MITIIDYNAGNLKSVQNALYRLGANSLITKKPDEILKADKIIFPGVGAAGAAMQNLNKLNLISPIKKFIKSGKPFLGICLGAQILLESSEEDNAECLGIIRGQNKKFNNSNLVVPQIGWNQVNITKSNNLFKNIPANSFFYFLNSYYFNLKDDKNILSKTNYGDKFISAFNKNNIYGVQFHPEKSGKIGEKLLSNFVNLC